MRFGILPPALDDELLYSFLARVRLSYTGVISHRFVKAMQMNTVPALLPRDLNRLADMFPPWANLDVAVLLRQHTILPYYESTAEQEEIERARNFLSEPRTIRKRRLAMSYKAGEDQIKWRLRSCPECVGEDTALTGQAAWKRSHNLPEVYVCHRHDIALEGMTTQRSPIDLVACLEPNRERMVSPHGRDLTRAIASGSNFLLTCSPRSTSTEAMKQVMRLTLLGAEPGWKRNGEVHRHIVENYGAETLRLLGFPTPFIQSTLGNLITFSSGVHPLTLIFIAHLTGHSVKSLLEAVPTDEGLDLLWRRSSRTTAKPSAATVLHLREQVLGGDPKLPITKAGWVRRDRLRRADPKWFEANVPPLSNPSLADFRRREDARMAETVQAEVKRWHAMRPYVRVTRDGIRKALGITQWKARGEDENSDHYPQTRLALQLARESGVDFRVRKATDRRVDGFRSESKSRLHLENSVLACVLVHDWQRSHALSRRTLTDEQWDRIKGHLPGRAGTRGHSGVDNRLFVDAILWMAGNAACWRDLPDVFGKWAGVHARFHRWSHAGVWERLFHALADMPDLEYVMIDSTISKVHADASGTKGGLKVPRSVVRAAG